MGLSFIDRTGYLGESLMAIEPFSHSCEAATIIFFAVRIYLHIHRADSSIRVFGAIGFNRPIGSHFTAKF